jgi:putative Holliday junction resolvase
MVVAAIDLGTRRIGLAVSDSEGRVVSPLAVVERRSLSADIEAVHRMLSARQVDRVIVGLPLNMDGGEGRMAILARNFANRLAEHTGIAVELQDERLSSFEARERVAELGGRRRGRKKRPLDALAAAVILETWFEKKRRALPRS